MSKVLPPPVLLVAALLATPFAARAEEAAPAAPVEETPAAPASYETILITGARTQTATKTEVDTLYTPQNVQVLSEELLADQGAVLLEDALRNVAGVMPGGYYNGWDYYRIRGFDADTSTYQDGLLYGLGINTNAEVFGMQRVEVLKGPSSSLYGQGALGGLVNLISKRPEEERAGELSVGFGGDEYRQVSLDVTGSLSEAHGLSARLVSLYRNDGSFAEIADGLRRFYVAPSLTWEGEDTSITWLSAFTHDRQEIAFPLPALGFVLDNPNGQIPRDRYLGDAENPGVGKEQRIQIGYLATHRFNDVFSLRQNLRASWSDSDWDALLYPAFLDADQRTLYRYPYFSSGDAKYVGVDTAADAAFVTGSLAHTASFGVDVYRAHDTWHSRQIDYADPGSYIPIDLFDPEYGYTMPPLFEAPVSVSDTEAVGVYLQDQVQLLESLTLTVGGRYDWVESNGDGSEAFSPRVGVAYQVLPELVAYASYSRSFLPQSGLLASGDAAKPERGTQWEIGAKSSLLDGRVNATLSLYQLTRGNVTTDDAFNPGFVVTTGEQRSRGVELDSQIRIADGWELIAAYAYTDAEVTEDNGLADGLWTKNAPKHGLSSWLKYTVLGGPFEGLGFGFGVSHYTEQAGDLPNSFFLPSYTLVDANITYTRGPIRLQLNLDNLTDEKYATGSYNDLYVLPGRPLRARALATWSF
ncbi:MAG TPA: TonB-dependent siderophore receptor [Myxococcota bacterium]